MLLGLYNPLFTKNVSTNIGRTFLKLLDAEFTEEHDLCYTRS